MLREAKSSDGVERGGLHRKSRKAIPPEVGSGEWHRTDERAIAQPMKCKKRSDMSTLSNVETGRGQANPPSVRVLRSIEATEGRLAPDTIPEAKSSQTGVSVRYVPAPNKKWYVFRASYGREDKAFDYIVADGTYAYIAKRYTRKFVNGKQKKVLEALIPNLLFVYTTDAKASEYIKNTPPLPFYPIIITILG